ncbi:hypothetical protein C2E23DRAFT_886400 [Lenzites betulinus]|nr:hypothetical protein C2E23DRAFT_886400 [Lenzites betulinus]
MLVHAPPRSTASIYSQMTRAASMFSDTFTSVTAGSGITTCWAEGDLESSYTGSPHVVKRCARLEAEVSRIRKRLNTEMVLLPIVKSTDAGGLTCQFMFPADKDLSRSSAAMPLKQEPVPVSRTVQECGVDEAGARACTETLQNVDSEGVEEARVADFNSDAEDLKLIASPSADMVSQQDEALASDLLPLPVVSEGVEQIEYDLPLQDSFGSTKGCEYDEIVELDTGCVGKNYEKTKNIDACGNMDAITDEIEGVAVLNTTAFSSTPVADLAYKESESRLRSHPGDVSEESTPGCEEELPSSIGTLVKWSHDTPLATSSEAGGYSDVSASLTKRGIQTRRNRSTLEAPSSLFADVFNLGISGAYRSAVYSPVTSTSLPWFVRAMHRARTPRRSAVAQPPLRLLLAPSSLSPSHPASLSVHSPAQVTPSRRLPDVYISSEGSSTSPPLPGSWQWSTSCTTRAAVCDDLRSTMNDIINFLLLGALLSYLLLTPAVSLLLFLWTLWGSTINPAPATTTSTHGPLRPLVTSAPILQASFPAQPARSLLVPRSPLARLCSLYGAQARLLVN